MKYFYSTRKALFLTLAAFVFILAACRKEEQPLQNSAGNLAFLHLNGNKLRINQAMTVYDSTFINDSIEFISPPTHRYYDWEVIPDNGCDSITGNQHLAMVNFIFRCSGTYQITAKIYDSLTQSWMGNTDTLEIIVTSDTLHPTQPIHPDDVLKLAPAIVKSYNNPNAPPMVWVHLVASTTKLYQGYFATLDFDHTTNVSGNNYSYVFQNHIKLNSYPFFFGPYNVTDEVVEDIQLQGLIYGVPATLSITWLGITYTGTVTLLNENQYTINWNNSGAVIIQ